MMRISKFLPFVTIVVFLGIIVTAAQKAAPAATGSAPVTIVGPFPLPVSGSLSAQQNGTWNVNISGTPNVHVANSATAPLLVSNVDDVGRIPYQATAPCADEGATNNCVATFPAVPQNHRLVLQHVSLFVEVSSTSVAVKVGLGKTNTSLNDAAFSFFKAPTSASVYGSAEPAEADVDQPVLAYVEANDMPIVSAAASTHEVPQQGQAYLSGYMLDCSVAACTPIAH